jgi:hypothetical protein
MGLDQFPDQASAPNVPGLDPLRRSFAMALSSAKLDSSGMAWTAIRRTNSANEKREIIYKHFAQWRDGCVEEIQKFFPQYIELALAYPNELKTEVVNWAEEQAWIPLSAVCGAVPDGDISDHSSHCVAWWLRVITEGFGAIDESQNPSWLAPTWLISEPQTAEKLILDLSTQLNGRICGALSEAREAAEVQVAIRNGHAKHQEQLAREERETHSQNGTAPIGRNTAGHKKPGRPKERSTEFEALAGNLWLEEMKGGKTVNLEKLRRIASKLDGSPFNKPSEYLENRAAKSLREHNRHYGNSPDKKIMSWIALVESGDTDLIRAMRKLLNRCAKNVRK